MIKRLINILVLTLFLLMIFTAFLVFVLYHLEKNKAKEDALRETSQKTKEVPFPKKEKEKWKKEKHLKVVLYLFKEKDRLIEKAFLILLNREEKSLSFYEVDGESVFEITKESYRSLKAEIADLPQVSKLSHFYSYSKSELGLKSGVEILNDAIGLDFTHYIGLDLKTLQDSFDVPKGREALFFQENLKKIQDAKTLNLFLSKGYQKKYSDFTKQEIKEILKEIGKIEKEKIEVSVLAHTKKNRGIFIKKEEALRSIYGSKK